MGAERIRTGGVSWDLEPLPGRGVTLFPTHLDWWFKGMDETSSGGSEQELEAFLSEGPPSSAGEVPPQVMIELLAEVPKRMAARRGA